MSELSSVYQVQYDISDYVKLAYNWGDATHPETYQSFVTTGKGLIDQSIFSFQRKKDAWSIGSYMTQVAIGADKYSPLMYVTQNNLGKNNVMMGSYIPAGYDHLISDYSINGTDQSGSIVTYYEYSPQVTLGGLAPYIDYSYDRFIIIPFFTLKDPSTGARIANGEACSVRYIENQGYTNCYVDSIQFTYGNYPSPHQYSPVTVQYAGKLIKEKFTTAPGGGYEAEFDNILTGVYYIPYGTLIYNGFAVNDNNICLGIAGRSYTVPFDLTQMDWRMITSPDGKTELCISYNDAIKIMNSLGFYWGKSLDAIHSARGIDCDDPEVVCPVIDPETHMVTDTVLSGSEISDYAEEHLDDPYCNFLLDYGNKNEHGDPIGLTTEEYRSNFNPEQPTIEPADEIDLNEPVIATTGGTSVWLMNQSKLEEFFTYLWNPDGTLFDDIVKAVALLGENPMDSVISCRYFPLNLADTFNSKFDSNYRTIIFGRKATTVTARHMISSNVAIYDLGSFMFNDAGMFNDFRDYEPYSEYSLYLPFVGITPLAAIECINAEISIKYIIDLITGACTAVIYTNGVPYKYLDGMIGIEVPVTGRNMAQYGQQILSAALGGLAVGTRGALSNARSMSNNEELQDWGKSQAGTAAINMSTGHTGYGLAGGATAVGLAASPAILGAAMAVGGTAIGGGVSALINNPSPQQAGSNVPAMGLAKPLYPYFIVQRSNSWIPDNYAKLHGRLLQQGGKVGDFTGFSTFSNLKLENIPIATSEEKTLISKILASGVYI